MEGVFAFSSSWLIKWVAEDSFCRSIMQNRIQMPNIIVCNCFFFFLNKPKTAASVKSKGIGMKNSGFLMYRGRNETLRLLNIESQK